MNQPDERTVYLALRSVFAGNDAKLRQPKKIRERIINEHSVHGAEVSEITSLVQQYNLDSICMVAKRLLDAEVYQSNLRAKIRFPELFDVSPAQNAERAVSDVVAARREENVFRETADRQEVFQEQPGVPDSASVLPNNGHDLENQGLQDTDGQVEQQTQIAEATVPSLYPVYLPMQVQYWLMREMQSILERSCYDYSTKHLQSLLKDQGWDCAECVELHVWTKVFSGSAEYGSLRIFSQSDKATVRKPFAAFLESIAQIRHTAVHRLTVTSNRIALFLTDSDMLAKLLGDEQVSARLVAIRRHYDTVVEEIKRNKDLLETKTSETLKELRRQRQELIHREKTVVSDMIKEDKRLRRLAAATLSRSIEAGDPDTSALDQVLPRYIKEASPGIDRDAGSSDEQVKDIIVDEEEEAWSDCLSTVADL